MKRHFLQFFVITISSIITYSIHVSAQTNSTTEYVGVPQTGEMGVNRTTDDIMKQEKSMAILLANRPPRFPIEHEVERDDLDQNPESPAVDRYPAIDPKVKNRSQINSTQSPQTFGTTFLGATLADAGAFPPDVMGTVGPTQFIVAINGRIRSFNKTTGVADGVLNASMDVFFSSVMSLQTGTFTSDPHIRYDRIAGRWFVIIIDVPAGTGAVANRCLIAVSNTSTISLSTVWTYFYFVPNVSQFADYPTLGVDKNALYIGFNIFTLAGGYNGTLAYVVRKSSILGAGPIVATSLGSFAGISGAGVYTPQGADNFDTTASEGYFIGSDNASYGLLQMRRVSNPGGTPSVSGNLSITVPTTGAPITVPHLGNTGGTNGNLDALDDRLFAAVIRNGRLWTAHNIAVNNSGIATSGDRDGSRWYEIGNLTTTPILIQSGTVYDNTSGIKSYWIPSVNISAQGHVAMGFSVAGANDGINCAAVGRFSSDVTGAMQTPALYTASSNAYNPPSDPGGTGGRRWGDYSYTSVDPNDDMTMWTIQEYCSSANNWGVQAVKLIAPPPAIASSSSPLSVNTNANNVNVIITGTSSSGSGFFDPGSAFPNRISAAVNGGGVTVNSVTYTDPTHITLNISIAAGATAGARTITVTNPDGQSTTSATGILTINSISCPTIALSPSTLRYGAAGASYNQTISASGGQAPYTYSVTSGLLPTGVTLSTGGSLSGTPTYGGTYNFSITATDNNSCTGVQAYSLTVTGCPQVTLSPATLPNGTAGTSYGQTITAAGGTQSYTYTVSAGTLPTGLSLALGGILSGTPTVAGTYNFTVTATDGNNCTGSLAYSQTIDPMVLTDISFTSLGAAYTQNFNTLANTGTPAWTNNSTIPGWFASVTSYTPGAGSSSTGALYSFGAASSTERALGSVPSNGTGGIDYGARFVNRTGSTITSLAINYTGEQWRNGGNTAAQTLAFQYQVANAGVITSITSGTWTSYTSLDFSSPIHTSTAAALDGNTSANRTAISATLPVSVADGQEVWIRWHDINDSGNDHGLAVDDLSVTPAGASSTNPTVVGNANPSPVVAGNATLLTATVTPGTNPTSTGITVTSDVSTIGGSATQTFYDDGTHGDVTAGDNIFSFSATVTSGTTTGVKSLPISVADAQSRSGNTNISLTVTPQSCPTITLSPSTLTNGTVGVSYSQNVTASGGIAPYTYSVTVGSLPTGLTLSSGGSLSGTPTTPGTSNVTITTTDSNSCTSNLAYSLTINPAAGNSISLTTLGSSYTQDFNTLANTGTSSVLPAGWAFNETGANANTTYAADSGGTTAGNTYSYGNTGSTDRAFGGLQSGTLVPTIGASLTNNTGATINSLAISYWGEEWRLGTRNRFDTLQFQYSMDATSLTTGTWTSVGLLNYLTTDTSGATGFRDGNTIHTNIVGTISSLSISNGSTFWIRWLDANATSADDGLAIDDFSITPSGLALPTNPLIIGSANPSTVVAGNLTLLTATVTPGTNPASTGLTVTGDLSTIGGSATQAFYNDGTNGDVIAGDNIFSFTATVSVDTPVGSKSLPISVSDAQARSGNSTISLTVTPACPSIAVSPSALPDATIGTSYNQSITASGGKNPYTFTVSLGSLPNGLSLSIGGLLSGTPNALGSSTFTVSVIDSNGCTGSKQYTVQVSCSTVDINPTLLPNDSIGKTYNQILSGTGGHVPYLFSVTGGALPDSITLSTSGILSGTLKIGGHYSFTVTSTDMYGCSGYRTYSLNVVDPDLAVEIAIEPTWNMLSNPVVLSNDSVKNLFPKAISDAFTYIGGTYQTSERILNGNGYWLKFNLTDTVKMTGRSIVEDSVNIFAGWNMIGSISQSIPVGNITTSGTVIASSFFGFNRSYISLDTIKPGAAFWVKVTTDGKLKLSQSVGHTKIEGNRREVDNSEVFNQLNFVNENGLHQTLLFGVKENNNLVKMFSELPPIPPAGGFDVRFGSQRNGECFSTQGHRIQKQSINITTESYPVTINWHVTQENGMRYKLEIQDGNRIIKNILVNGIGSYRFDKREGATLNLLAFNNQSVSDKFMLYQNYPNPFNPVTTIEYELPIESKVVLTIYNILGQVIQELKNEIQPSGYESVEWDAKQVPSGIYFYKLEAMSVSNSNQHFTQIKKMLLLK